MAGAVRRMRVARVVASAGMALGAGRVWAQAIWTNATGNGSWFTPGNWSTGAVPDVGTSVTIPGGGSGVSASNGIGVLSISAMSPVAIGAGGSTIVQGGSFTDLSVTNSPINAGGPVLISGTSHMGGATFYGGHAWTNTGTMTVNPGLAINAPTVFINDGTVNVEFSLTLSGALAGMTNSGTLRLVGQGKMLSGGLLTNTGVIRKSGGGTSTVEPRIISGGAILVDQGTLSLSGPVTFTDGGVAVTQGGVLRLEQPSGSPHVFNGLMAAGGSGEMVIATFGSSPAAVEVIDEVTFSFSGGAGLHLYSGHARLDDIVRNTAQTKIGTFAFSGIGEFHNEATGTLIMTSTGGLDLRQGVTLINEGMFNVSAPINLDQATLANNAGGVIEWIDGGNLQGSALTGKVRNRGTLKRLGGVGLVQVPFDQSDGGTTTAHGATIALTAGGQWGFGGGAFILSGETPEITLNGGAPYVVTAGEHVFAGPGRVQQNSGSTVRVEPGATLRLSVFSMVPTPDNEYRLQGGVLGGLGTITNTGQFDCAGTIGVNGEADFRNNGLTHISGGGLTGTFTNNATRQVLHTGSWNVNGGRAINDGEWICVPDIATGLLLNPAGEFRNHHHFVYVPNAIVGSGVYCGFDNAGLVTVIRGTLQFSGPVVQLQNGALTGGIWEVFPGATLILPPPLTKITTGAKVIGARTGQIGVQGLNNVAEISQGGALEATGDINFSGPLSVVGGGRLLVHAPATVTVPQRLLSGSKPVTTRVDQKKSGDGPDEPRIVAAAFENSATAGPGGESEAGPFNLTGTYLQKPAGELEIEIGGPTPIDGHDRMDVTGPAVLGGTLRLELLGGFVPSRGQSFTILTATGGVTGRFTTVRQPAGMPPGLEFIPIYGAGSVGVVVGGGCYADCNTDGALSVADFGCFQTLFVTGHTYADCNADGVLSVADFGCFQTRFVAGCP